MKASILFSALVFTLGLGTLAQAANAPLLCTIRTYNGRYVTAVGGGNRVTDVLHTDARRANAWEMFKLIDSGDGNSFIHYGIQTVNGHYLTAVGGGNRITDVIHSDATQLQDWEKFTLYSLGSSGYYAIRTIDGHWMTAVGGGGRVTDVMHTNATRVGNWEKFRFRCRLAEE
jgi:hypothetical protein